MTDLRAMLQKDDDTQLLTPFGVLAPPLGSLRLKAAEMVQVLFTLDDSSIRQGKPSILPGNHLISKAQLFEGVPLHRDKKIKMQTQEHCGGVLISSPCSLQSLLTFFLTPFLLTFQPSLYNQHSVLIIIDCS